MGNKTTGRNWTRRSIEEIFDDMFAKKGGSPGPSPSQGDVCPILSVDANFIHTGGPSGSGAAYYLAYDGLALGEGTVRNRPAYKIGGTNGFDVMRWPGVYTVADLEAMIWKRRLPANGILLYLSSSGSDLYLASYYGEEIFTIQMNNVTATYTSGGVDYPFYCQKFPHGTAVNLDEALQACSGYGTGGSVLLIRGYTPADMQALNDTSLLSIANTVSKYYSSYIYNNIIRV